MVDWANVAAFITPLVAAIVAVGGWFAWLDRKRKEFIQTAVNQALATLEIRISAMEKSYAILGTHLDRQDTALAQALQSIARIEGRLMQGTNPPGST